MDRTDYDLEGYNLASNPDTSADELVQLAERSSDMGILALIAAHPNASGALLAALWTHPHVVNIRYEAKNNPNPRDFAGYDASDEDNLHSMEGAIARHPNVPEDMLKQFSQQARFGSTVANNPSATPEMLEAMIHNGSHYAGTIREVGRHPNTPTAALDIVACRVFVDELDMIKDHPNLSALAREIIAYRQGHDDASAEAITQIASYGTIDVLNRIIGTPDTPASVLRLIFNRLGRDFYTLGRIAQHPNTPPDVLAKLALNQDERIQNALARNPNFQRL